MYKSFSIISVAALASLASATDPWEGSKAAYQAPPSITVDFQGAPAEVAHYVRSIPANGQPFYTNDPLSISHIVSDGSVPCTFYGVDGLVLPKSTPGLIDVGPPQTITYAVCGYAPGSGYKAKRFEA
ncbi:uncharacterized protein AB675_6282 [Cyphellophora attinorum]|uniref:Uncharacterized protein n=1 Tax=Cyphellophora attinorum TaxID=1664694 RepID=A0A0N0NQM5_9EURO|nr:uncharacterized protein AB675_6282 [Phialophora attinorum]KPI43879.1 hypothetical protein AB675_6282 [Phialophora attinorum]